MKAFLDSGAAVIAEDLGTVPDFVRASLCRLGIPGYKVFRWEREWEQPDQPFRNPANYPRLSVATTGTHDTDTLVEWWEAATAEERSRIADVPFLASRALNVSAPECDATTRDQLLQMLASSSSNLLVLPVQDIFGWSDRINVPGTVTDANWTWRLPWPVDVLEHQPEAVERAATMAGWMKGHGRAL
jgi:4-alpha-glucanotransferase